MSIKIKEWINNWEEVINQQAKLAGIYEHNLSKGMLREFFIKHVVKNLLPPLVEIGSGFVLDSKNKISKQIDIIIFDTRHSRFSIDENLPAYYPVEGVIATIEVKSELSRAELKIALENCFSVNNLTYIINSEQKNKAIANWKTEKKWDDDIATTYVNAHVRTATFIFGYKEPESFQTILTEELTKFVREKHIKLQTTPILPRVISTKKYIGIINDPDLAIKDVPPFSYVITPVTHSLGLLISQLMLIVNNRLWPMQQEMAITTSSKYLYPAQEYIKELDPKLFAIINPQK